MSLRLRWTLALVAVCLAQAGLVAAFVSLRADAALDRFVYEQSLRDFTQDVEQHVRATGTLEGFRPATAPPRPPGDRRAGPPPSGARPPRLHIRWGLADLSGRIVIPFGPMPPGTQLSTDQLEAGTPLRVDGRLVATVLPPPETPGALGIDPGSPGAQYVAATRRAFLWGLGLALGLALVLGVVLASRAVRPLQDLTEAAARIADGDRAARVEVRSGDEVGQLAEAFNAMSVRLAEANALRERMTADISHDLRTPLTAIMGTLEALQAGLLPATPERLDVLLGEAVRMRRLVDDLHTLALADARELSVRLETVAPQAVLRRVAQLHEAASQSAGVELVVETGAAPSVQADPDRLVQVLGNLVTNAIRHTPAGGRITLRAQADGGGVELVVMDSGEGIPPDVLPIVFERSVRADAARSGTGSGLGLSIVRSLVEAMGGRVQAASSVGEGTTMTVWLPRAGQDA